MLRFFSILADMYSQNEWYYLPEGEKVIKARNSPLCEIDSKLHLKAREIFHKYLKKNYSNEARLMVETKYDYQINLEEPLYSSKAKAMINSAKVFHKQQLGIKEAVKMHYYRNLFLNASELYVLVGKGTSVEGYKVIKRNGSQEDLSLEKLADGIRKATVEGSPITSEKANELAKSVFERISQEGLVKDGVVNVSFIAEVTVLIMSDEGFRIAEPVKVPSVDFEGKASLSDFSGKELCALFEYLNRSPEE